MTTQEENLTISKTPPDIPKGTWLVKKCSGEIDSNDVLTTITDIDLFIEILQNNISALENYRKGLINRALSENIAEDANAVLILVPGKKMRNPITDIEHFKTTFPEGYRAIRYQQIVDIQDKHEKELTNVTTSPIPLGIADAKIGKEVITEFTGYKQQEVNIVVQRKQGAPVGWKELEI